jgi:hypothetical protein
MRPIGTRRGNPIVRRIIEQGQRRRLYYALSPDEAQVRGDESDPRALRWTREFFERLRSVLVPRMAVTEAIDGGELRYFGAEGMQLWALHREHELVVAYDHGDSRTEIRDRARRWVACLRTPRRGRLHATGGIRCTARAWTPPRRSSTWCGRRAANGAASRSARRR